MQVGQQQEIDVGAGRTCGYQSLGNTGSAINQNSGAFAGSHQCSGTHSIWVNSRASGPEEVQFHAGGMLPVLERLREILDNQVG